MKLLRRTERYSRQTLVIGRSGVEVWYERRKTGGGWYRAQSLSVPWPWSP